MLAHYLGGLGWDDHVNFIGSVDASAGSITLAACPSHYEEPGYDALDDKGTFYAYNILAELDTEGEYYVNRTSGMLYVWPPSGAASPYWTMSPWGKPVVPQVTEKRSIELARARQLRAAADPSVIGELSVDADLLVLVDTAFLTFDGLVLTTARNAGVLAAAAAGDRLHDLRRA
jgi:hypothetical protein